MYHDGSTLRPDRPYLVRFVVSLSPNCRLLWTIQIILYDFALIVKVDRDHGHSNGLLLIVFGEFEFLISVKALARVYVFNGGHAS